MRYFIDIQNTDEQYTVLLNKGDPSKGHMLFDLQLGPQAELSIKGHRVTLHDIIQALIAHNQNQLQTLFDERGQLEIGQYLYGQLFGNRRYHEFRQSDSDEVEIRIVTDDEHLTRLPWILLADSGIFLAAAGWSVTLSAHNRACPCCELPPSPNLLIVAPEPRNVNPTQADVHIDELLDMLIAADHHFAPGKHTRIARTWEEFTDTLTTFDPHCVYYYGHGVGAADHSRLVFGSGPHNMRKDVPVADVAACLRNRSPREDLTPGPSPTRRGEQERMAAKPSFLPLAFQDEGGFLSESLGGEVSSGGEFLRLVYVNCCLGDAGGFLGVGRQFGDFVPAVMTNRTIAQIAAARGQALSFWEQVLLKGIAPHRAMSLLYRRMADLGLSVADVRWMTPVLHCGYDTWSANPPQPPNRLEHDPHWHVKIDRVVQFSIVAEQTRQMLRERKPRSLAFVWYGQQGQGVGLFHQRLKVEFQESLTTTIIDEVLPEWPMDLHNPARSFRDMLTEAFGVGSLDDIPARIRTKTHGAFGTQTLVYVRHQPVASSKLINPKILKLYLEWWNAEFVPLLNDSQVFALLGVSFVVNNPPKFRDILVNKERLEELYLDNTIMRLLDEMEHVAKRDLLDFLRTHNIRLPLKRRDSVLERILEKTNGHYERTIEELKHLVDTAWDLSEEDDSTQAEFEEDYDY